MLESQLQLNDQKKIDKIPCLIRGVASKSIYLASSVSINGEIYLVCVHSESRLFEIGHVCMGNISEIDDEKYEFLNEGFSVTIKNG